MSRPATASYRKPTSNGTDNTSSHSSSSSGSSLPKAADFTAIASTVPYPMPLAPRADRLREAARSGDLSTLRLLLNDGVVDTGDLYGMTSLHTAAWNGNEEVCEELLRGGTNGKNAVNIHSKDRYGQTPLLLAASECHYKVLLLLLNHKASVNYTTPGGHTALHRAASLAHPHSGLCIQLLLDFHANIHKITKQEGESALFYAVRASNAAAVPLLVLAANQTKPIDNKNNGDVNSTRFDGNYPIHVAAQCNSVGMVELLIAYGADDTVKNEKGETVRSLLCMRQGVEEAIERGKETRKRRENDQSKSIVFKEKKEEMEKIEKKTEEERRKLIEAELLVELTPRRQVIRKEEEAQEEQKQTVNPVETEEKPTEEADSDEGEGGEAVAEEEDDEKERAIFRASTFAKWQAQQAQITASNTQS